MNVPVHSAFLSDNMPCVNYNSLNFDITVIGHSNLAELVGVTIYISIEMVPLSVTNDVY